MLTRGDKMSGGRKGSPLCGFFADKVKSLQFQAGIRERAVRS